MSRFSVFSFVYSGDANAEYSDDASETLGLTEASELAFVMLIILVTFPSISAGALGKGKAVDLDLDIFVAIEDIVLVATEDILLRRTAADWEDNTEVDSILFLLLPVDALV